MKTTIKKPSLRAMAMEMFTKKMGIDDTVAEMKRQGREVKRATIAAYYASRNRGTATRKTSATRTTAKVIKMGARTPMRKIRATQTSGRTTDIRNLQPADVIDWINTQPKLAKNRRQILNMIVN
jgi:glutamyl-tRNA reductase